MSENLLAAITLKLLQMRYEKRITAIELVRAEALAAGQLGLLTWTKYINALLSTRGGQPVHRQNGQNNSKMVERKG